MYRNGNKVREITTVERICRTAKSYAQNMREDENGQNEDDKLSYMIRGKSEGDCLLRCLQSSLGSRFHGQGMESYAII